MRLQLRPRDAIHARCDDDPPPFAVLHPVAVLDWEPDAGRLDETAARHLGDAIGECLLVEPAFDWAA